LDGAYAHVGLCREIVFVAGGGGAARNDICGYSAGAATGA
jgi:hypothetical protein